MLEPLPSREPGFANASEFERLRAILIDRERLLRYHALAHAVLIACSAD
jgi:hypothetical protein